MCYGGYVGGSRATTVRERKAGRLLTRAARNKGADRLLTRAALNKGAATERLLIAKGRSPVVKAKEILAGEAQTGGELVCRARNSHLNKQEGGMPMQFGIFYEIQVPKPWYETKEFETYRKAITFA